MEHLTTREGIEVHCLVDGVAAFPPETFPDLPDDRRTALLATAGETEARTRFNTFLVRGPGTGVTLVDTGKGGAPRADGGNLLPLLAALGVAPGDVTRLFLTHLHSDHCGGALSPGGLVFPNAQVVLHEKEILHWRGKDAPGGRFLDAHADRLMAFNGPADLGGGLRSCNCRATRRGIAACRLVKGWRWWATSFTPSTCNYPIRISRPAMT